MANIYKNITLAAPTTTTVSAGPAILSKIVINKATANGVITVYDGTAAQNVIIATITSPATLLANQVSLDFGDVCTNNGITIVTSTAAQDITVAYRPA